MNAAGAMHVLHVIIGGRRYFAETRDAAADGVDAGDVIVDAGFARDGERMQDGVGGPAHGDVQGQRIVKSLGRGDVPRFQV